MTPPQPPEPVGAGQIKVVQPCPTGWTNQYGTKVCPLPGATDHRCTIRDMSHAEDHVCGCGATSQLLLGAFSNLTAPEPVGADPAPSAAEVLSNELVSVWGAGQRTSADGWAEKLLAALNAGGYSVHRMTMTPPSEHPDAACQRLAEQLVAWELIPDERQFPKGTATDSRVGTWATMFYSAAFHAGVEIVDRLEADRG